MPLNLNEIDREQLVQLTQYTWDNFNLRVICSPLRYVVDKRKHRVRGFIRTAETTYITDLIAFEPLHPIGAGDSYVGAFLSRFFADDSWENKCQFATNAYAIKHIFAGDINYANEAEINAVSRSQATKIER